MIPTEEQEAIFTAILESENNLRIEALAGTGKTTTILKALELLPSGTPTLFLAFNKTIADELEKRVPEGVEARTLHSLGNKFYRTQIPWFKVNGRKTQNILKYELLKIDDDRPNETKLDFYNKYYRDIVKIISLLKSSAVITDNIHELIPLAKELADYHSIDWPEEEDFTKAIQQIWLKFPQKEKVIDFDDMIYLPVVKGYVKPIYEYVFVDEAQDLNQLQRLFISKLLSPTGRVIVVGDSNQAIYGFRGADTKSLDNFQEQFNAEVLPLTVSFRCSPAVVAEAKKLVPDFQHRFKGRISDVDLEELGVVDHITEHNFHSNVDDGDFVLCRVTKDLVEACLKLIAGGKKAKVRGKEMGTSILAHIDKIPAPILTDEVVEAYFNKLIAKNEAKDKRFLVKKLQEELDILLVIIGSLNIGTREYVKKRTKDIFSDKVEGITLSTIHKIKGLEADKVFLIRPDLIPHPKAELDWELRQEQNMQYVAITRAKKEFYYVG